MKEKMFATLLLLLLVLAMTGGVVQAQRATPTPQPTATPESYPPPPQPEATPTTPAPTPTEQAGPPNDPPTSTGGSQGNINQGGPRGSIRGTVFEDVDGDGQCQAEDTPTLTDVPIGFQMQGGPAGLVLYTGDDGTFGLVAAGLGEWHVSAEAPSGYVVTSESSLTVTIDEGQRVAQNVDFCLSQASAVPILLPESGAPAGPISLMTVLGLAGALIALSGLLLLRRSSRSI